jgi:hypothetical protein
MLEGAEQGLTVNQERHSAGMVLFLSIIYMKKKIENA